MHSKGLVLEKDAALVYRGVLAGVPGAVPEGKEPEIAGGETRGLRNRPNALVAKNKDSL
jgi:hypothetical protein